MPFKCNEPAVPTVQQEDTTVRITRWDFAPGAAYYTITGGYQRLPQTLGAMAQSAGAELAG